MPRNVSSEELMSTTTGYAPTSADYAIVAVMVLGAVPSVVCLAVRHAWVFRRALPGLNRFRRWVNLVEAVLVPLAIAGVWMWQHRPPEMLGLGLPTSTPALIALGLGVAWSIGIAAHCWSDIRHCRTCDECQREWREEIIKTYGRTPTELRRLPPYLGVLSAVVEEVIFRGFLIWVLTPLLGVVGAVIAAALCFGIGHAASMRWAFFATCVGLLLGIVYALTESLWGIMIAHVAQNLSVFLHHRALAAMAMPEPRSTDQASAAPSDRAEQ
jgi:membrane protease YdiL (CAAX protease family)